MDLGIFHQGRVVLRLDPSFILKVNTWFHGAQELVLPNFCLESRHALEHRWHILEVRWALCIYIKWTYAFRKPLGRLSPCLFHFNHQHWATGSLLPLLPEVWPPWWHG